MLISDRDAVLGTDKARGTGFALSGLTVHLNSVATLFEPEPRSNRYRSVAAAVNAIRVDHTYRNA